MSAEAENEIASGVHPSGLRDAISLAHFGHAYQAGVQSFDARIVDQIAETVTAYLASVSEGEIEHAARDAYEEWKIPERMNWPNWSAATAETRENWRCIARRVLLAPKDPQ